MVIGAHYSGSIGDSDGHCTTASSHVAIVGDGGHAERGSAKAGIESSDCQLQSFVGSVGHNNRQRLAITSPEVAASEGQFNRVNSDCATGQTQNVLNTCQGINLTVTKMARISTTISVLVMDGGLLHNLLNIVYSQVLVLSIILK